MFESYKTSIEKYCSEMGIDVPIGFERRAAGRFAAIDLDKSPPRLIAITWSKEAEVVSYLQTLESADRITILDFKDCCQMTFSGKTSLHRSTPLAG
ncbi:MAG: hypothetical protein EOP21_04170 [Hyphomicrobiales bacterium]|nr:MAG: hypothetical protein EOP21_04170 [Hyphomicrobiales bacterium]